MDKHVVGIVQSDHCNAVFADLASILRLILEISFSTTSIRYLAVSRFVGAPVAQWVKRWPTDVAVVSSIPALGKDLFNRKRGSTALLYLQ